MFALPKRYIYEALAALIVCIFFALAVSAYTTHKRTELLAQVVVQVAESRNALAVLNTQTGNNQADQDITVLLKECGDKDEYERRVGELLQSTLVELNRTKVLFLSCGDHDARRKQLMVQKMSYALKELRDFSLLSASYTGSSEFADLLNQWEAIVALEKERSQLLSEQVELQGVIIDKLGMRQNYSETLQRANEVGESLQVKSQQAKELAALEDDAWKKRRDGK